jgi:hypothetical protein
VLRNWPRGGGWNTPRDERAGQKKPVPIFWLGGFRLFRAAQEMEIALREGLSTSITKPWQGVLALPASLSATSLWMD